MRLKTEAAALGFEWRAGRGDEVIFKLRRTTRIDRVALVKRFRTAPCATGRGSAVAPPLLEESLAWLGSFSELLPVIVGAKRVKAATSASQTVAR